MGKKVRTNLLNGGGSVRIFCVYEISNKIGRLEIVRVRR